MVFSYIFIAICRAVFYKVDYNKNGKIEDIEVEVAVLNLYNKINKRLPGWQEPPSRATIRAALKAFDSNHDGVLDIHEFESFARQLVSAGPDTFFARIGANAVINTGLLPASAFALQRVAGSLPVPGLAALASMPPVFLAPLIGTAARTVRALLPV